MYVETDGCYYGLDDVDPWDINRDARFYKGPHAVVAHPPCERWGRYWFGGPSARIRRALGDDAGCFTNAITAVRRYGGVLEHPEGSAAWTTYGLEKPPKSGGWIRADKHGWTCCVEQGHYGHKARKATYLYVVGLEEHELPHLKWGSSGKHARLDEGFHSKEERRAARAAGVKPRERLSVSDNIATPPAFRDELLSIARRIEAKR